MNLEYHSHFVTENNQHKKVKNEWRNYAFLINRTDNRCVPYISAQKINTGEFDKHALSTELVSRAEYYAHTEGS